MLEILLALVILAIGIVSVMALFPIALNELKQSMETTRAQSLARLGRATLLYLGAAERIIDHPEADDDPGNASPRDNLGFTGPWFYPDDDEVFFPGRDVDAVCNGDDVVLCGESPQYSWEATIYQKYPGVNYFNTVNGVDYLDNQLYQFGVPPNSYLTRYLNALPPPIQHQPGDMILAYDYAGTLRENKLGYALRETTPANSKKLVLLSSPGFLGRPQGIPYRSVAGPPPTGLDFTGDFTNGVALVSDVQPDPTGSVNPGDIVIENDPGVDVSPLFWTVFATGVNQITLSGNVLGIYDGTVAPPLTTDDTTFTVIKLPPPAVSYYSTTGTLVPGSSTTLNNVNTQPAGLPELKVGDYIRDATPGRWFRVKEVNDNGTPLDPTDDILTLSADYQGPVSGNIHYGRPLESDDVAFNVQIAVYRGRQITSVPPATATITFTVGSKFATSSVDLTTPGVSDIEVGNYIYLNAERWWYRIADISGTNITLEEIYTPLPYTPLTVAGSEYQAQNQAFSYTKKIVKIYNTMIGRD